jgi:ribosomal protein L11 methyltransferase
MPFWQLTLPSSADSEDALTNFLWEQGALGVVEEEAPGAPPRLRAFFAESVSSTELLAAVQTYQASLRSLGFAIETQGTEITTLLDEAWASAWQQSFPPREVGRRLLVLPPWLEAPTPAAAAERLAVVVEPGRAFGTGHHGTTEGCLALLEDALAARPAPTALDIGTGTGILAIAAVKLGVPAVVGLGVDPDAVAAARGNAERNRCAGLTVHLAEPGQVREQFPLVLANLLTHTHLQLGPEYARLTAPGGSLILGGMLDHEDDRVGEALAGAGFVTRARLALDGWASRWLEAPPR